VCMGECVCHGVCAEGVDPSLLLSLVVVFFLLSLKCALTVSSSESSM